MGEALADMYPGSLDAYAELVATIVDGQAVYQA